jgi:hypothetical protein
MIIDEGNFIIQGEEVKANSECALNHVRFRAALHSM